MIGNLSAMYIHFFLCSGAMPVDECEKRRIQIESGISFPTMISNIYYDVLYTGGLKTNQSKCAFIKDTRSESPAKQKSRSIEQCTSVVTNTLQR